jgi:heterodisulfide reductase subunit C
MQPTPNAVQSAQHEYETHLKTCRQCAADGAPCPVARHLRRVYNNAMRQERRRP